MSSFTLQTLQLTRRFGNIRAVDEIHLNVPQHAVYGFLGPNGAGKTTAIRMILGLIRPHQGEIYLFGSSLRQKKKEILKRVGALVEMPSLYPHLTGQENLEVQRILLQLDKSHIQEALKTVQLEQDARRLVKEYSLGMKQRLGLAMAILSNPELLILDEPTNGLDPAGIIEMRELLRSLPKERGITVFLSSHLLNEVEQVATSIGIIDKGKLLFEGSLSDLQQQRHNRIDVEVDKPAEAIAILKNAGWKVTSNGSGKFSVDASSKETAGKINQTLSNANIQVYYLALVQSSLEEMFLHMTTNQRNDGTTQ